MQSEIFELVWSYPEKRNEMITIALEQNIINDFETELLTKNAECCCWKATEILCGGKIQGTDVEKNDM